MFKWLKKLIGGQITDSVTEPSAPKVNAVVPVDPVVAAVAVTTDPVVESKPKRQRAKKSADVVTEEAKTKRSTRSTPPKQAKTAK